MIVCNLRTSALIVASVLLPTAAAQVDSDFLRQQVLGKLEWRNLGPANFGGRIVDLAVDPRRTSTFYVATATGGVFKTLNNGTTFKPVFENEAVISVGDIAVAPSAPEIVYIGTGEANNQRSSYWGDGVYRSTNGGESWTHCGLERTEHIGRIVVHPTDPDVAWVAALGALYTPNPERGLFRTKDGGRSWECVKAIDEDVGFVDVAIDPANPDVLFAASYQRRRRAHDMVESGPGSGLWKSTDAGDSWQKLAGGLPSGNIGRIGLAVYPANPKILYALIENNNPRQRNADEQSSSADDSRRDGAAGQQGPQGRAPRTEGGEVWRSDDGGETWKKQNRAPVGGSPHYYYGQIRVSPTDDQRLYVLGVRVSVSSDGGKSWDTIASNLHSDHHALEIDPRDEDRILLGNDAGLALTYDGGETWDYVNDLPIGQFYAIGVDMRQPYWVYGGTQDNGTWGIPSRAPSRRGLRKAHAVQVNGGDGFYVCVDPEDPNTVYSESQFGAISRLDLATGERKSIKPRRERGEPPLRSNWSSPILISPHNARTIYFGTQYVHRSRDRGDHWQRISEDLTTNDAEKIKGNVPHCTITTLAESPREEGLLLAGSDDGKVWLSRNAGERWTDLSDRFPGLRSNLWVSRVEASYHDTDTFYVSFTGYRDDLREPYLYMTTDGGEKFVSIAATLPRSSVNVIREHPRNANVLFVGNEEGVQVSIDAGASWHPLGKQGRSAEAPEEEITTETKAEQAAAEREQQTQAQEAEANLQPPPPSESRSRRRGRDSASRGALPTVPVHDLLVHPRDADLIVGTHGRGLFILDIAPLENLDETVAASSFHVFPPRDGVLLNSGFQQGYDGHRGWSAPNPPTAAVFRYYFAQDGEGPTTVRVLDAAGRQLLSRRGTSTAGMHTVEWNPSGGGGRGGVGGLLGGGGRARFSGPGEYLLEVTHGETVVKLPFKVLGRPQLDASTSAGEDEREF